jgi:hypothetical protein
VGGFDAAMGATESDTKEPPKDAEKEGTDKDSKK